MLGIEFQLELLLLVISCALSLLFVLGKFCSHRSLAKGSEKCRCLVWFLVHVGIWLDPSIALCREAYQVTPPPNPDISHIYRTNKMVKTFRQLWDINERRGPWSCEGLRPQCRGMPEQGSGSGWVGEQGKGAWDRRFLEWKRGKRITFEM
jgi:hypothetical protein